MILDHRYQKLDHFREYLSYMVYPIQWVVNAPERFTNHCRYYFTSNQSLVKENERLREEQLLQNARLQKLMALEAENLRLLDLLNSSPKSGESLKVAEILQVDTDPFSHNILLNKGRQENVYVGQPIIDAHGVLGEIIEVNALSSRAILITDASHAIPVENVRNGVRGIVVGTGRDGLELQYVPTTSDIQVGDLLVTSGLGGRYPSGYPVGKILEINQDKRESFASVLVSPSAHLKSGRQVLLIESESLEKSTKPDAASAKSETESQSSVKANEKTYKTH